MASETRERKCLGPFHSRLSRAACCGLCGGTWKHEPVTPSPAGMTPTTAPPPPQRASDGDGALRPAVLAFALAMEERLRRHDTTRGVEGWTGESDDRLVQRLREEERELTQALEAQPCGCRSAGDCGHLPDWAAIRNEAADMANFAMMLADNHGSLEGMKKVAQTLAASPAAPADGELLEALREIAEHPHIDYDHPSNAAVSDSEASRQYGIGCADGHRCAANIARRAIAAAEARGGESEEAGS